MTESSKEGLRVSTGICSKVAKSHGIDSGAAKKVILDECEKITELYKQNKSLAFFDDIHRAALHVIGQNNAVPLDTFAAILRDLEICDTVLMQVKGILKQAYRAEKKTQFIVSLQSFFDRLATSELQGALLDAITQLSLYSKSRPENPTQNDQHLLDILTNSEDAIPEYVNPKKRKEFELDRIDMIRDLLVKFKESSVKEREENPWA